MKNFALSRFNDKLTFELLKSSEVSAKMNHDPVSCFWIGSADMANSAELQRFLDATEREAIDEIQSFSSIAERIAYAILVQDASGSNDYHLCVIEACKELDGGLNLMLSKKLRSKYQVLPKEAAPLPEGIIPDPRKELWKAFFDDLIPKAFRRSPPSK